jgi:NAD(P)H-quinone oxidoreductase subunit 4L
MNLQNFLILSAYIFCMGIYGLLTSTNLVRMLLSLELILNAININFISFSYFLDNMEKKGEVISLFVMTLAAAEAAIALSLILAISRTTNSITIRNINILKD